MMNRSDRSPAVRSLETLKVESVFGNSAEEAPLGRRAMPAVPVAVKRRRSISLPPESETRDPGSGLGLIGQTSNRQPRVFTIERPPQRVGDSTSPEFQDVDSIDIAAATSRVTSKKRRRRDAEHAPGKVTRIVYEKQAVVLPLQAFAPEIAVHAVQVDGFEIGSRYLQIVQAIDRVQGTLGQALEARQFLIA